MTLFSSLKYSIGGVVPDKTVARVKVIDRYKTTYLG